MELTSTRDPHITQYYSLSPFQFCRLRRLELLQIEDRQRLVLELTHESEYRQLTLTFDGVTDFEFLSNNFQPVPLFLEIALIVERQWQGINYQVFNTEQDVRLSFYCREFQAEVQEHNDF